MASMTAKDVVKAAARRAQITAGEESPSAAEFVDWLAIMNRMMAAFPTKGIAYAHTDLKDTDTVNMPDRLLQPLILMLVNELADDVGITLGEKILNDIDGAKRTLQAAYYLERKAVTDPILQYWPLGRFNYTRIDG
ncbi:MAG: hypothetical protein JSR91_00215 [Proteobacteria bacterium]|nr:hypothetical protein [Pseudomonadota bacterium]